MSFLSGIFFSLQHTLSMNWLINPQPSSSEDSDLSASFALVGTESQSAAWDTKMFIQARPSSSLSRDLSVTKLKDIEQRTVTNSCIKGFLIFDRSLSHTHWCATFKDLHQERGFSITWEGLLPLFPLISGWPFATQNFTFHLALLFRCKPQNVSKIFALNEQTFCWPPVVLLASGEAWIQNLSNFKGKPQHLEDDCL